MSSLIDFCLFSASYEGDIALLDIDKSWVAAESTLSGSRSSLRDSNSHKQSHHSHLKHKKVHQSHRRKNKEKTKKMCKGKDRRKCRKALRR